MKLAKKATNKNGSNSIVRYCTNISKNIHAIAKNCNDINDINCTSNASGNS